MTNKSLISVVVLLILLAMYMGSNTKEDEVAPLGFIGLFKRKKNFVTKVDQESSASGTNTVVPPPEAQKKSAYREGKEAEAKAAAVSEAEETLIVTQTVDMSRIKPFQPSESHIGRKITAVSSLVSDDRPVSVATAISDVSGGKIQGGSTEAAR